METGLGIRGSGFGVRDSGFGVRDSGFGIRDSGFGIRVEDGTGMTAAITTADVYQSNGVIHVIDAVVMAK